MASAVLYRFETTIYRNNDVGDPTQIPYAGAGLDFYRQGATVKTTPPDIVHGTTGTVTVYDPGELKKDDIVSVGTGGAELVVDQDPALPLPFPGPVDVQLRNPATTGQVHLAAGTRLLLLSRRPDVFADPVGTFPLGHTAAAGADGRIGVYVSLQRFDYVIRGVGIVSTTSGSLTAGTMLTWQHLEGDAQNCILVGVSWRDAAEEPPAIVSAKYAGANMTLIGTSGFGALYRLLPAPPTPGARMVEIVFDNPAHAVGGALSLSNVASFPTVQTASSTNAAPSVIVPGTSDASQVLGVLTVNTSTPSPTAAPSELQAQRWNNAVGSSLAYCLGAGSSRESTNGSTTMMWVLGASAYWELVAAEARPLAKATTRLCPDARGGTMPNPTWVNAWDFVGLSEAVSSIPNGGEIFLPIRNYSLAQTLLLDKPNITLIGESKSANGTVIMGSVPDPLVKITQANISLRNLEVGEYSDPGRVGNTRIVLLGPYAMRCYLENLTVPKSFGDGLRFEDAGSLVALNTQFIYHLMSGVNILRTAAGACDVRLLSCYASQNDGPGILIDARDQPPGASDSILLFGSTMESNAWLNQASQGGLTVLKATGVVSIACYFEWGRPSASAGQFVYSADAPGLIVAGAWLQGNLPSLGIAYFGKFVNSKAVVFVNNAGQGWTTRTAVFEAGTGIATEFGNSGSNNSGVLDLTYEVADSSLFSLSQGAMQIFGYATVPPATAPVPGSLRWIDSLGVLQVFTGTDWKDVAYY